MRLATGLILGNLAMSAGAHESVQRIDVIDSHTGGEPTRVVIGGGPDLGSDSLMRRRALMGDRHDAFRSAVINEPRGSDVLVGALLCEPCDPTCASGVIFFNNAGCLGMCGHGAIGVMATLAHLGRIEPGEHRLETPVGIIAATLWNEARVSIRNVPSYRLHQSVAIKVDGYGMVTGDVAWGGNWFFLVNAERERLELNRVAQLTDLTRRIRKALEREGVTGADQAEIDHIELFGPAHSPHADSRNFVLCPGLAYDRSPCGTGTSAKMACLAADGKLLPGRIWRQESIIGSLFEGSIEPAENDCWIPTITGSAYITAESVLILHPQDPLRHGIRP